MFIKEVLRLYPPVFAIARRTENPVTFPRGFAEDQFHVGDKPVLIRLTLTLWYLPQNIRNRVLTITMHCFITFHRFINAFHIKVDVKHCSYTVQSPYNISVPIVILHRNETVFITKITQKLFFFVTLTRHMIIEHVLTLLISADSSRNISTESLHYLFEIFQYSFVAQQL